MAGRGGPGWVMRDRSELTASNPTGPSGQRRKSVPELWAASLIKHRPHGRHQGGELKRHVSCFFDVGTGAAGGRVLVRAPPAEVIVGHQKARLSPSGRHRRSRGGSGSAGRASGPAPFDFGVHDPHRANVLARCGPFFSPAQARRHYVSTCMHGGPERHSRRTNGRLFPRVLGRPPARRRWFRLRNGVADHFTWGRGRGGG